MVSFTSSANFRLGLISYLLKNQLKAAETFGLYVNMKQFKNSEFGLWNISI